MKFLWKKPVVSSFVTVLALFAASFMGIAPVGAADHGQLVGEFPRRDVPVVLDGEVRAHALIGDRIFVGGEFQQVQRPDGTTIDQPYIFAYNINTGLLDENFRPVVNNGVWALEVNPRGDALYAGGRFVTWDDSFVDRVVKLDAFGNRDTSFQATASAIVRDLAVTNDDVYLAGDFFLVGGEFHAGFAAVDANTGAVDSGFIMDVENSAAEGQLARGIVVTSDGNSVFGMHFGTRINGDPREALVKIDTSGNIAGLADWRVDWSGQTNGRSCLDSLRDIAIAPDDSFIVIGGQGADNPPNCDSVLRYPTDGTGVIGFDWSARMYSSVFSLGVSDTAVYVGGHFCAAPLNGAVAPSFQTHERTNGNANSCNRNDPNDPVNPSVIFPNDAVFRNALAALDPLNGKALAWDPGSNAALGTFDLTLIDRGLLAGMDNDRYGNFILTGRSGFFDFGGFTPAPPAPVAAACVVEVINNVPVVSYSDFTNVSSVSIRRNGTFIDFSSAGTGTYEDTSAVPGMAYSYEVRSRPGGVLTDVACTPETIIVVDVAAEAAAVSAAEAAAAAEAEAVAAAEAAEAAAADALAAAGAADAAVAAEVATAEAEAAEAAAELAAAEAVAAAEAAETAGTAVAAEAAAAAEVAAAAASEAADVAAAAAAEAAAAVEAKGTPPTPEPEPPAPGEMSCSVSVNAANNGIVVSYSGFTTVSNVQFRRNDGVDDRWIGSGDPGAGDFDDISAVPGVAYSYVVRSRPDGVRTDVACTPATITIGAEPTPEPEPEPEPEPTNVALNQPVVQSTTAFSGVASRAVDGNTNGSFNAGSVTHTVVNSNNPWWRVDLGATHNVSQINIFNRTNNCCSFRLNGAVVYVGDVESNNPADYTAIGTLNGGTSVQTFTGVNTTGRYVMVRINGTGTLSLAEVEVLGTP